MIGKEIRGANHFFRIVGHNEWIDAIFQFGVDMNYIGKLYKTKDIDTNQDIAILFLNDFGKRNCYEICEKYLDEDKKKELKSLNYNTTFTITNTWDNMFRHLVMLPPTFRDDYKAFVKENKKLFQYLYLTYNVVDTDMRLELLYAITEGSKNFFDWAAHLVLGKNISLDTIESALLWNKCYHHLVKRLSKKSITAYTTKNDINTLFKELNFLRKEKRVHEAINGFNTEQRKILKGNELSNEDKTALAAFVRLTNPKKTNFIKKYSTIHDFNELMTKIKYATKMHFEWNKASFLSFITNIEELDYKIISDKGDKMLLQVNDFNTVKYLGKSTSWCITENMFAWDMYANNDTKTQYMLFDFSKDECDQYSIVGFTVDKEKHVLTAAHNTDNDNILHVRETSLLNAPIKVYDKNIYDILDEYKLNLDKILNPKTHTYGWNKKEFIETLYSFVDKNNVKEFKTPKTNKGQLILVVEDSGIADFFGENYNKSTSSFPHLLLADFSKGENDPTRLEYVVLTPEYGVTEPKMIDSRQSSKGRIFKLVEFGIFESYKDSFGNIEASSWVDLINEAWDDENIILLKYLSKRYHGDFVSFLQNQPLSWTVVSKLLRTFSMLSTDYLDLIYDNGLTLFDVVQENVKSLVDDIYNELRKSMTKNCHLPTETEVKKYYEGKIDKKRAKYIGHYLILKKIIETETCEGILNTVIWEITFKGHHDVVSNEIINIFLSDDQYKNPRIENATSLYKWCNAYGTSGQRRMLESCAAIQESVAAQNKEHLKLYNEDIKLYNEDITMGFRDYPAYIFVGADFGIGDF